MGNPASKNKKNKDASATNEPSSPIDPKRYRSKTGKSKDKPKDLNNDSIESFSSSVSGSKSTSSTVSTGERSVATKSRKDRKSLMIKPTPVDPKERDDVLATISSYAKDDFSIEDSPSSSRMKKEKKEKKKNKQWVNSWKEMYIKHFGEDDWNKNSETQWDVTSSDFRNTTSNTVQLESYLRLVGAKFLAKATKDKDRATHQHGVGATGIITFIDSPKFPAHDFFVGGHTFPVRVRHANLGSDDDAAVDLKSIAIKFNDSAEGGPFDMILQTGEISVFWNLTTLEERLNTLTAKDKVAAQYEWLRKRPYLYKGSVASLRREPKSYTDQHYYSQVVYDFIGKDNKRRACRYRVIPFENVEETGLLPIDDQYKVVERSEIRDPACNLAKDYLRKEFKERVSKPGGVKYIFQISLHDLKDGENKECYNAGKEWDETTHPWFDVGIIHLSTVLPEATTWGTKYNLANHPATLPIPVAYSAKDYNSVLHARTAIYPKSAWIREKTHKEDAIPHFRNACRYLIVTKTGDNLQAGTDATVKVMLIGTKGRTNFIELKNESIFANDRERGEENNYSISEEDVGELLYLKIDIDSTGASPDWYLQFATVVQMNLEKCYHFPAHRWIVAPGTTIAEGTAILPQNCSDLQKEQRKIQTSFMCQTLPWTEDTTFPNHARIVGHANLPRFLQFSFEKMTSFLSGKEKGILNLFLGELATLAIKFDEFEDYLKLYANIKAPAVSNNWQNDVDFGYQMLCGTNPVLIRKCTKIPEKFAVTDKDIKGLLKDGATLEDEIKNNKVYILDYEILEDVPISPNKHLARPICLMYVNAHKDLVPIAIQLQQRPGADNPIFTPNDPALAWLFAKIFVRNADFQVHQLASHLLRTHLIMEPFYVSMLRALPESHPVYKLLAPHFKNTIAINTLGRERLINANGPIDRFFSLGGGGHITFMEKVYKTWNFHRLDFIADLQDRGVSDPEELPGYFYRDDGVMIWNAITNLVKGVIEFFYKDDKDVVEDWEIQDWIGQVHSDGLKEGYACAAHKIPERLNGKEDLIHIIRCLIFTCSAGHASANFGQFDYYGFVPNAPAGMYGPPPTTKNVTLKDILHAMPKPEFALYQMVFTYELSRYSVDEVYLGDYPENLFLEEGVHKLQNQYKEELVKTAKTISERNSKVKVPYIYMSPEKIPNSIAV